jgi:predicted extracellular nuclease
MHRIFAVMLLLTLLAQPLAGVAMTMGSNIPNALFTQWTFESFAANPPATGTGAAVSGSGLTSETFPSGYPSGTTVAAWSFASWTTNASLDANDYFEFDTSTAGYNGIILSFAERRSATGIHTYEVHYSTDGVNYQLLAGSTTTVPDDINWRAHVYDFSTITALNDNPNAKFRIYGYGAEGSTGTWRIDDVAFDGTPLGGNQPISMVCGGPLTAPQGRATLHQVSATDPDGTVVSLAVTNVSPSPAPGSITMTGVTPAPGNGGTATGWVTLSNNIPAGSYNLTVTATNDDSPTPQTRMCTIDVTISSFTLTRIGAVQGSIPDNLADPFTFATSYVNQPVYLYGVVTDRMITRSSAGATYYHFYLQEPATDTDGNALSSDGVHVYIGASPSFSGYTPAIGDNIVIRATVSEYYNDTELTGPTLQARAGNVGDLNAAVPAIQIVPSGTVTETGRLYERLEGSRTLVPAGAQVVAPTHLYASTDDTEFYVIRGDHPVAMRANAYERRVFRDGHALDWGGADGNPWRISIEAQVLKGNAVDPNLDLPPACTYDTISNAIRGPIVYAFSRYTLNVEDTPALVNGVSPVANDPPVAPDRLSSYTVATFNVENLYDYYNDPFDGCDFTGDPGCTGVTPPFDYVPANLAEYQTHITKVARAIVDHLRSPDVIAIEEAEDQDVCTGGGQLYGTCGSTNNADGQNDVLQDLARQVYIYSGNTVQYALATDRVGSDYRGIIVAFLWRSDRVRLAPNDASDPLVGSRPSDPDAGTYPHNQAVMNPKALQTTFAGGGDLFEREPQAARFQIYKSAVGSGPFVELYVIGNHFKSNPDTEIPRRTQQAQYNAGLISQLLAAKPAARAMVTGDLNVYPDSPQLASLYTQMSNLYNQIPSVGNFSYNFSGQSQTLDQMYVTSGLFTGPLASFQQAHHAHFDADYPYQFKSDPSNAFAVSDHDPLVATFALLGPTAVGVQDAGVHASAAGAPGAWLAAALLALFVAGAAVLWRVRATRKE